ncbi:MAG: TetR/AcrR family transcriptional regulator [Anaerolineaceae bacterium]|jgi:TetR/AcrR family transcriptional repressor of lmrAB and yxaGH operons|nr:TetR/AcrR family transcriptional regulator [Anaerolineaceae bacterium]
MTTTREKILATTSQLMEAQGYAATGLNQIIEESGSPKGSLYYYFPEGKEQLTEEAIRQAGEMISEQMTAMLDAEENLAEAFGGFVDALSQRLLSSGCRLGGPLTTVALETANTSPRVNQVCQEMYRTWQEIFRARLERGGFSAERAASLAVFINAAIEGGIILSRTRHTAEPLLQVARELRLLLSTE